MIISRYLTREVLQTLLAVLVVVLLIFMGRYFAIYLADAASGEIAGNIVLEILLLRTLTSLNVMIPFTLFIAVMLAFGRLYKDSEMAAMAACGIGPNQVMSTVIGIALMCSVVVAGLSFWASPWANEQTLQTREQAQADTLFASVAAGQFNEVGDDELVFYVEEISEDRSRLRDVFIQTTSNGRLDIYSAKSGYQYTDPQSGQRYLVLVDGYRYQGLPGEADFTIHQFEKNAVHLQEQTVEPLRRKRSAIANADLWQSTQRADQAELHWRFAMPVAALLLPVLGVMLSRTSPRQGRFAKLFIAIFLFVIYYNGLGVGMSWIERGKVPAELGLWWVHGLLLMLIAVLALRHWGGRWLWYRLMQRTA